MAYSPAQIRVARQIAANAPGTNLDALLVATGLVESNLNPGAVGDQGHSVGPFQEYDQGRGAGLTASQRSNVAAATSRAYREFSSLAARYSGPELAYRAQRPADHSGYVQKVAAALPQARALLGMGGGARAAGAPQGTREAPGGAPLPGGGGQLTPEALRMVQEYADRTRSEVLAGKTPDSSLPIMERLTFAGGGGPTATSGAPRGTGGGPTFAPGGQGDGYLGIKAKIIGTPGAGTHTLGNWESDNAIDLAAPVGTPVYAISSGTIGSQFGSLGEGGRFAGLRLHLQGSGNEWYYAHLSKFAPGIKPGARVRAGQLLGYSGEANGVGHLHLGVRSGDPRSFLR